MSTDPSTKVSPVDILWGLTVVTLFVSLLAAIIQNHRRVNTKPAEVVQQRPTFQTDELTHVLNRLHQLRFSWEHRQQIIVGDKAVMQRVCLGELTTELKNIEAILERVEQ